MIDHFSSYLDLLLFQPAVMFTVNQYSGYLARVVVNSGV